jgi:TusE/DsrC/DsvC family sulfur relay protein
MAYTVNGSTIEHDEEGYLTDINEWNEDIAVEIAKAQNLEMNEERWEVVNFLRNYYDEYQVAPAIRVLTKALAKTMGPEKGNNKQTHRARGGSHQGGK